LLALVEAKLNAALLNMRAIHKLSISAVEKLRFEMGFKFDPAAQQHFPHNVRSVLVVCRV
jgi:hypothetical protein